VRILCRRRGHPSRIGKLTTKLTALTRVRPVAFSRSGPEVARAYPLSAPRAPQSDWQIDREADGLDTCPPGRVFTLRSGGRTCVSSVGAEGAPVGLAN